MLVDGGTGEVGDDNALVIFGWPALEFAMTVAIPTPAQMCAFLGWNVSEQATVAPHLYNVMSQARAYTRGNGFGSTDQGDILCTEDIASVIMTATARLASNPTQLIRQEVGGWSEMPAIFTGFTIIEELVPNRYRRRTA